MRLAQVNIARPLATRLEDLAVVAAPIDASAEAAPGCLWRLPAMADRRLPDGRVVVNLSLWTDLEALRGWAYSDVAHLAALRRRREWFARSGAALALWWAPDGPPPTVGEAQARLHHLDRQGPTPWAFTFRVPFERDAAAA